ncbi:hypothetical protein ACH5RR_012505 [Cinchona calisaya]|uniref:P-type ATPase C-terminal domain-containing protein n=1 Tax=Cinchona calisaya TaxID=153742 RepID=A0ABD3A7Y5_9GENT
MLLLYKNVTFGFTMFLYEAYASFSTEPAYNDWFLSLYDVFFTSLPIIASRVFDQDVSARFRLKARFSSKEQCSSSVVSSGSSSLYQCCTSPFQSSQADSVCGFLAKEFPYAMQFALYLEGRASRLFAKQLVKLFSQKTSGS